MICFQFKNKSIFDLFLKNKTNQEIPATDEN